MNKKMIIAIAFIATSGCTDPIEAERVLSENGYTDILIGGYAWLSCGEKDQYKTEFSAKSPSGHAVNGAVCHGVFKGSTIRFE